MGPHQGELRDENKIGRNIAEEDSLLLRHAVHCENEMKPYNL